MKASEVTPMDELVTHLKNANLAKRKLEMVLTGEVVCQNALKGDYGVSHFSFEMPEKLYGNLAKGKEYDDPSGKTN